MEASQLKTRVPIERVLSYYGSRPNETGIFHCPVPGNHANGDANPSGKVFKERAFCHSQKCFGEKGADIFAVAELMEQLPSFANQKAFIENTFCASKGTPHTDKPTTKPAATIKKTIIQTYDYTSINGELRFQVVRFEPKDFRQRRPDGNGGWIWNLKGVKLVLYRLFETVTASHVIIVEGEKDVETLFQLGMPPG